MRPITLLLRMFAAVMCAVVPAQAAMTVPQKPVLEQETLHAVPASFGEMWNTADIVAKVRITHSSVEALPSPGPVPRIHTIHEAVVIATFKGSTKNGERLKFSQVAGELETKDAIIRITDEEPLPPGEYVVFLQRLPNDGSLALVGDVDGAYKVHHGFIEPQGRFTTFAAEHRGMSESRFLREIEAIGHRAPKRQ